MFERVDFKKITIDSCKFIQLAIFSKYFCVHGYDRSINPILLKIDIYIYICTF